MADERDGNGIKLPRRPHPSHDRKVIQRMIAGLLGVGVSLGIALALGQPFLRIAGAVFLLSLVCLLLLPVNRCRCPQCGEHLERPGDSQEFACDQCRIVWTTKCRGGGLKL